MYIPKNRIKPDLHTPGGEFILKSTGENYAGSYHQLYTGKYFTGKNPDDKPVREIIRGAEATNNIWETTANDPSNGSGFQQYVENFDGQFANQNPNSMEDLKVYNSIKNVDWGKTTLLPQQYYPNPTEDDYNLGSFTRYFAQKRNELIYLEINEDTYKNLNKRDPKWAYDLYRSFKIQWTLVGDQKEVYNTNRNIVLIEERRSRRIGLGLFLKENYLKFYKD